MTSKKKLVINKKEWSDRHTMLYDRLYKQLHELNPKLKLVSYLDDEKRNVGKYIDSNKDWSKSYRSTLFYMIARYYYNKGKKRDFEYFAQKGYDLWQSKEEEEANNGLDA